VFGRREMEQWLTSEDIRGRADRTVSTVVVDSRRAGEDCLFVALKGERTDGHRYIADVLEKGAAAIVADRSWLAEQSSLVDEWQNRALFIASDDTLLTLQDLARGYRMSFSDLTVIGVTGSNGKTTTKEIIYSILSRSGKALCNEGNLNSDSGLPLSVFRIREYHRYTVLEMGMNRVGEMASLARVALPDLVLVTNVGTAHIGMIGSRQGIAEEKKAVFSCFNGKQTAFLNENDSFSDFLSRGIDGRVVTYGPGVTEGYEFIRDEGIFGQRFRLSGREVQFPLPGFFNAANALGAVAVARELGFGLDDIAAGLESCGGQFGRAEVLQGKSVTLFRDCYNANGDSMAASLELFGRSGEGRRRIAVLGDMGELGSESGPIHKAVLDQALNLPLEGIFLLGREFGAAWKMIGQPAGDRVHAHGDFDEMSRDLLEFIRKDDLIMLKGSRIMALERLTEPLLNHLDKESSRV
jgi:UDP-N-acetylmuramoyl-tripeptide--D-alanyl-D-alanine ligase